MKVDTGRRLGNLVHIRLSDELILLATLGRSALLTIYGDILSTLSGPESSSLCCELLQRMVVSSCTVLMPFYVSATVMKLTYLKCD